MTTPLDIITASLRSIGVLASGEPPDSNSATDALATLNDMLASWSNERMMLHYQNEVVFNLVGGTFKYTIGPGGTVNSTLTGSQSLYDLTITAVSSGAIVLGQTIGSSGITETITSFGTGAGGTGTPALGTYKASVSQTLGSQTLTAYYPRPLRVNGGFTRVGGIDYLMQALSLEDYQLIGLKTLSGPWPRAVYYQATEQLGNLTFWPAPTSGEVHLFCDMLLGSFGTLSETIQLPEGMNQALKWCLSEQLLPEYGRTSGPQAQIIMSMAAKSRAAIKRTNMQPQAVARVDPALMSGRANDAGWILSGGYS